MTVSWFWIQLLLLSLTTIQLSYGIQCYYCTSQSDTRCTDTSQFASQTLTSQPSECTQVAVDTTLQRIRQDIPSPLDEMGNFDCVKVELSNHNAGPHNRTIIRGCVQGLTRKFDPCNEIKRHFTNYAEFMHCSVCKTDACNSAPTMFHPTWFLVAAFTILLIFGKRPIPQ